LLRPLRLRHGLAHLLLAGVGLGVAVGAQAQASAHSPDLNLKLACSTTRGEGEARVILADSGEMRIIDGKLLEFRWESSLHRRTHGFDCSMDMSDLPELQRLEHGWRVSSKNAAAAREARGFDTDRGQVCFVTLTQQGETLHIAPNCPALCGSRNDFSELKVHLPTGRCDYLNQTE
jgi:hypothetical protein